jgi:hypothetical protein
VPDLTSAECVHCEDGLRYIVLILACALPVGAQALGNGQTKDGIVVKALEMLAPARPGPLTERERLHHYLVNTYGWIPAVSAAASSGIAQWDNSPPEWGQGAAGYGRRVAHRLAFIAVRNSWTYGVATLLHEDTRYFASSKTGVRARVLHALISPARARRRSGRESISISGLSGIIAAGAISRVWSPPSWQGMDHIGISIGLTYAGTAGFNVLREFAPDIIRAVRRR